MQISVVMPAFNEEANIETTVRCCFEVVARYCDDPQVVVTDDGSTDNTPSRLLTLAQTFPGLIVETNRPNQGYGAALARAMKRSTGDIVVSLDSDGQFDIADLESLLPQFTDGIDILTGYRKQKKDSWIKVFGDRAMNRMIRLMFSIPFKDTNCALKLYRGDVIRKMHLEASGFQLPTEIVLKSYFLGLSVREAPVNHYPRKAGRSGLAIIRTSWKMFIFLLYLRLKIWLFQTGVIRSL